MNQIKTEEATKFMQATTQIMNDLSTLFFEEDSVDLLSVEKIVLSNLDKQFPRVRVAELAGISVRTVRNKLNSQSYMAHAN